MKAKKKMRRTTPPVLASAIARLSDPEDVRGIDTRFLDAYARMPAAVEELVHRGSDHRLLNSLESICGLKKDADIDFDFVTPIMTGAFITGMAYASFVLLEKGGGR
jgi:hypothetical protein